MRFNISFYLLVIFIIVQLFNVNILLTSFLVGYAPNYFYIWHTIVRLSALIHLHNTSRYTVNVRWGYTNNSGNDGIFASILYPCVYIDELSLFIFIFCVLLLLLLIHSLRALICFVLQKAVTLLSYRWYSYKQLKFHYFLFDFCYFTNFLTLLYIWIPSCIISEEYRGELFTTCFSFAMGPLLSAIIFWRNSLVPHSTDKMTSLFIHISPPLTLWGIRWYCLSVLLLAASIVSIVYI